MHEVSLDALVPSSRVTQLLHLLSGLTASRPASLHEEHRIYAPTKQVKDALEEAASKALQAQAAVDVQRSTTLLGAKPSKAGGDLHILQLKRDIEPVGKDHVARIQSAVEGSSDAAMLPSKDTTLSAWTIQMRGVPDPGIKTHSLRYASHNEIKDTTGTNIDVYLMDNGFEHRATYNLIGHRFVYNNIVLRLANIETLSSAIDGPPAITAEAVKAFSGPSILSATVRVSDGTNPALVKQAQAELDACRARLKGVVDLRAPDRLSLDTRAR